MGSSFGTLSENSKIAIKEIIRNNPDKTSRELTRIIKTEAHRDLAVQQIAGVRKGMGQHGKRWLMKQKTEVEKHSDCWDEGAGDDGL